MRVTDLASGRRYAERYDDLLIATGLVPGHAEVPGVEGPDVFVVHTLLDGELVRAALAGGRVSNAVVVGAGYIGLETAESLVGRGVAVTVLDQAPAPMTTLDPDMSEWVADGVRETGITLMARRRARRDPA